MAIQVGERLPEGTLSESTEFDPASGCPLKPQSYAVGDLVKDKKIVIFGLPGAFTPTCSAQHLPGYIAHYEQLCAKGIDEIWCMAVNDGFVMAAWGRECNVDGKIRMMADGSAAYTKKLGLEFDLTEKGMGVRCQRFAMLVDDGVVKHIAVEAPGKLEVSNAESILALL
ncbi:MAG: redoxin family protein [Gammaproteobacteria bacterium]